VEGPEQFPFKWDNLCPSWESLACHCPRKDFSKSI